MSKFTCICLSFVMLFVFVSVSFCQLDASVNGAPAESEKSVAVTIEKTEQQHPPAPYVAETNTAGVTSTTLPVQQTPTQSPTQTPAQPEKTFSQTEAATPPPLGENGQLGKDVGEAVNEALASLPSNVEKIGETKIGKLAIFIVAFKILGQDMIRMVVGVTLIFAGFVLFVWTWKKNCIARTVLRRELPDGTREYDTINAGEREEMGVVRFAHFAFFVIYLALCSLLAFLG